MAYETIDPRQARNYYNDWSKYEKPMDRGNEYMGPDPGQYPANIPTSGDEFYYVETPEQYRRWLEGNPMQRLPSLQGQGGGGGQGVNVTINLPAGASSQDYDPLSSAYRPTSQPSPRYDFPQMGGAPASPRYDFPQAGGGPSPETQQMYNPLPGGGPMQTGGVNPYQLNMPQIQNQSGPGYQPYDWSQHTVPVSEPKYPEGMPSVPKYPPGVSVNPLPPAQQLGQGMGRGWADFNRNIYDNVVSPVGQYMGRGILGQGVMGASDLQRTGEQLQQMGQFGQGFFQGLR